MEDDEVRTSNLENLGFRTIRFSNEAVLYDIENVLEKLKKKGHADIVRRALSLFDEIVIAVGYNEQKQGWLPVEERVAAIKKLYEGEPRVRVESYTGLTVDFAKEQGIGAIVRGVRTVADFEYELQLADVNRRLTGIETLLLPASPELASLSSSIIRELAHFGHDVSQFLPQTGV